MSLSQTVEITCPQCGTKQPMTLWSTVNVTVNPELREEVLKQRLNIFQCPACEYRQAVDYSVLYHDMTRGYAIQYIAKEDMKSEHFYSNINKDGTLSIDPISKHLLQENGNYLTRPHHVFSMNEMLLYIAFRDLCAAWGKDI